MLTVALLTLGWRVVKQAVLPSLKRKGNLLYSVFLLFTGLTELVINFAEDCSFRVPARLDDAWTVSRKYLRRGMLIATWALFILSSLEWSPRAASARPAPERQVIAAEQTAQRVFADAPFVVSKELPVAAARDADLQVALSPAVSRPRWLLLRTIRI